MKFKILILLFCLASTGAVGQTADEIIARHIEAIGGRDNWARVKSIRMETLMKQQGAEIRTSYLLVDRKAMRADVSIMGMSGYTVITTSEGWSFSPWSGQTKAEAMTPDDVKNAQESLDLQDKFLTYKDLGKKLDYFGTDDIDGTECYKLKMTGKDGFETTFYIDPDNYQVIKQVQKLVANGQEMENASYFSDFTPLPEGIVVPMINSSDWGSTETTKIEINPAVDESVFKIAR